MQQQPGRRSPKYVVCIENTGYPASLEVHKIYRVLPDREAALEANLRVVDESGEDYLYPASFFEPIAPPVSVKKSLEKVAGRAR